MKKLKELLQEDKNILFEIEEKDRISFLSYAKENGCRWLNGDEINPEKDKCWFHIGMSKDLFLSKIGLLCWAYEIKTTKKYKYES